jgi:hypoxanthine-guanine phosphoribosyltransferase
METKSKWLVEHIKEIKEKYAGEYVVILKDKVISSGSTASDALNKISDDELKEVEVIRIPSTKKVFY